METMYKIENWWLKGHYVSFLRVSFVALVSWVMLSNIYFTNGSLYHRDYNASVKGL